MHQFPETEEEREAIASMADCIIAAQKANFDLAFVESPTRNMPEFERRIWAAMGELIATCPEQKRGALTWAAWASLTTDLKPGQRNAA